MPSFAEKAAEEGMTLCMSYVDGEAGYFLTADPEIAAKHAWRPPQIGDDLV